MVCMLHLELRVRRAARCWMAGEGQMHPRKPLHMRSSPIGAWIAKKLVATAILVVGPMMVVMRPFVSRVRGTEGQAGMVAIDMMTHARISTNLDDCGHRYKTKAWK
jgi:hypothetical protein